MNLSISFLRAEYRAGRLTPGQVMDQVLSRLEDDDQDSVWISTVDLKKARDRAAYLDSQGERIDSLPLYGLPFSVKDNIDVADEMTTAACPAFAYMAEKSAAVVQAALDAGAMFIGKTNLDQFATGLVGVRSPYGIPRNPFNSQYIPGGSSSGAGVSVSTAMVSFAFGTDTGGSGRVPASYNGIVGLKPAPGQLSRRGLVFACRSIDTATIFANSAADAMRVFDCIAKPDEQDPYCIAGQASPLPSTALRFGVPRPDQLRFFEDSEVEALFDEAVAYLNRLVDGDTACIDFDLLTGINDLMFFGPLLAERDVSVGTFVDEHTEDCHPVVQLLITGSRRFSAFDAHSAIYQIADARVGMEPVWKDIEVLMVPTVGSVYSLETVDNDPLQPNFNNGYYTNFANPLGLSAIATPFGKTKEGVPWGVTFLFKPGKEAAVAAFADSFSKIAHS